MCNFCNNIINLEERQKINWWDKISRLVRDKDGHYLFWTEIDDDNKNYYLYHLDYIEYCPKCERKLEE